MAEYHFVSGCNCDRQPMFVRFVKRSKPTDVIFVDHPDMIAAVKEFIKNIDANKEIIVEYNKGIQPNMVVKHPDLPGIWDVVRVDGELAYLQPSYSGVSISCQIKSVPLSELQIWRK